MSRKRAIQHHYEPRISPASESYHVLDWASARSQRARFKVLADNVQLEGKRLLDVGCGLGDLWAFLRGRRINVTYTGVDILDKMVQEARRRHPEASFVHADLFTQEVFEPGAFDVVFSSGMFNLNLGNNLQFLPEALQRLARLAGECLVFNLLHIRAGGDDERYFYYDPQAVVAALEQLGLHPRLVDDYLHNDFTIIARRQ